MAEEQEATVGEGEGQPTPTTPAPAAVPEGADTQSVLTLLTQQLDTQGKAIQKLLESQAPATPPTPAPEPVERPTPPERQSPEAVREYIRNLENFAESSAQEAARFKVAREFGIEPDDLTGTFQTPESMRLHAKQVAEIKRVEQLGKDLEIRMQQMQNGVPNPPNASTSGPSGIEAGAPTGLAQEYDDARKQAKTNPDRGVAAYLNTVYKDPSKRVS